jgi:hypothetical protein
VLQSSIIGPLICNIILDGLQNFIQDNLPIKYKKSKKKLKYLKYKFNKMPSILNSYIYLQVFCIRFSNDILILGKCKKLHIKKIQNLLIKFLNKRGLKIKNASVFQGKCFKPGVSFNFLNFTFKNPNCDSASFNKGKYTKLKFNPMSLANNKFSKYFTNRPYLFIRNFSFKKLKTSLKIQFSKKNINLSVKVMINKINIILRSFLCYYNFTNIIIKQLLPINNLLHKLFYKYLLHKYSSVPKIYSFIKTNFINQNHFKDKNKILLKITDIKPLALIVLFFKFF